MKVKKFNNLNESNLNLDTKGFISVDYDNGEWCGYYFNGKLLIQGHSMNEYQFFKSCKENNVNFNYISRLILCPSEEEIDEFLTSLPNDFKDLIDIIKEHKIKYEFEEL